MRDKNAPRGKVFDFKEKSEWNNEISQKVQLSSQYRSHMVVVLGKALTRPPGWVRIVMITSTLPENFNPTHYLPIYPTRKFQKGGVQLKLCESYEWPIILPLLSYVRIDGVEEVPLEILNETIGSDGLSMMLKEKSFDVLHNCCRNIGY